MPTNQSPVRSMLFVPGNREQWVEKAVASGADALVFDLEGSVPESDKETARQVVRSAIASLPEPRPALFVRTAPTTASWFDEDLEAVVVGGLAGVLLPQVFSVDEVLRLDEALGRLERQRGLAHGVVAIDPLVETPHAVREAYELAVSSPRVAYMGAGVSRRGDIARRVGYRWTDSGLESLFLRSKVLIDVRAAGIFNPLSGMWSDVADLDGLQRFVEQTCDLGYEGMMAIHPTHIPIVNEVFTPTADEIAEWRELLGVMAAAEAGGRGAVRFRGHVTDEAHVLTAQQGLARAHAFGLVAEPGP